MTTPLHCKVCAKPLHGQQRLYCGRPCKRRAYAAKQKLREAQQLADVVEVGYDPLVYDRQWAAQVRDAVTCVRDTDALTAADVAAHPDIAPYAAPAAPTLSTLPQPSLPRRLYAYIQLLGHTLYHVFDGWRTK